MQNGIGNVSIQSTLKVTSIPTKIITVIMSAETEKTPLHGVSSLLTQQTMEHFLTLSSPAVCKLARLWPASHLFLSSSQSFPSTHPLISRFFPLSFSKYPLQQVIAVVLSVRQLTTLCVSVHFSPLSSLQSQHLNSLTIKINQSINSYFSVIQHGFYSFTFK